MATPIFIQASLSVGIVDGKQQYGGSIGAANVYSVPAGKTAVLNISCFLSSIYFGNGGGMSEYIQCFGAFDISTFIYQTDASRTSQTMKVVLEGGTMIRANISGYIGSTGIVTISGYVE